MGNCATCESRSNLTAKLILSNGELLEFSSAVRVFDLLEHGLDSDCFICNADDMEFNEFLVEVRSDEVLRLGEVYFELPSRWRNHRVQAEDMAALAVKANAALSRSGGDEGTVSCSCMAKRVDHAAFLCNEKERPLLSVDCGGDCEARAGRKGGGRCRDGKFVAKLSVIVEEL